MKRMIAPDPYFFNEIGHHYAYHSALQQAFESFDYRVETIIPISCQMLNLDNARWIRFFHHSSNRLIRTAWHFFDYLRLFRRMRRSQFEKTILFLESYSLLESFILILAVFLFGTKEMEIWQVFRNGLKESPWKKSVYIQIAKIFRWRLNDRYRVFSDSEAVIESFRPYLDFAMVLLPIPHAPSMTVLQNGSFPKGKIRLWAAGEPRLDKGILEIKKFCSKPDPHLKDMELWLETNRFFDRSQSANLDIHWIPARLSPEEYLRTLMEADALLSPYDPLLFASRTSGPFVEAICAGKLVFVKQGSWLARELARFGLSECILDWDDPMAPSALKKAVFSEETHKKLVQMQRAYLSFHNLESFKDCLNRAGRLVEKPRLR